MNWFDFRFSVFCLGFICVSFGSSWCGKHMCIGVFVAGNAAFPSSGHRRHLCGCWQGGIRIMWAFRTPRVRFNRPISTVHTQKRCVCRQNIWLFNATVCPHAFPARVNLLSLWHWYEGMVTYNFYVSFRSVVVLVRLCRFKRRHWQIAGQRIVTHACCENLKRYLSLKCQACAYIFAGVSSFVGAAAFFNWNRASWLVSLIVMKKLF